MGLAERFKNRLAQKDIFSKDGEAASPTPTQYMSTSKIEHTYEYEDIEAQIIDKIRKTPYWNEYSTQKQESMINSYIDKKQMGNPISPTHKKELINNIMILSKHN
jgi:hypothetical protein